MRCNIDVRRKMKYRHPQLINCGHNHNWLRPQSTMSSPVLYLTPIDFINVAFDVGERTHTFAHPIRIIIIHSKIQWHSIDIAPYRDNKRAWLAFNFITSFLSFWSRIENQQFVYCRNGKSLPNINQRAQAYFVTAASIWILANVYTS